MRVHMLRLLPGADIVLSLLEFAQENGIQAAVILTCVGGTGQTTLRPANTVGSRVLEGMAYEIASLTGTLSGSGHNLHLTVSDSNCQVFSGHALGGTLVRTTCELAIGEIENVSFPRPFDTRTGLDELSIVPLAESEQRKRQRQGAEWPQGAGGQTQAPAFGQAPAPAFDPSFSGTSGDYQQPYPGSSYPQLVNPSAIMTVGVGGAMEQMVPVKLIGRLIGKGGAGIREIRETSGANVKIGTDVITISGNESRKVTVTGSSEATQKALMLIEQTLSLGP